MHNNRVAIIAIAVFLGAIGQVRLGYAQWLFTESPNNTANVVDADAAIDPTILRSRKVGIDWSLIHNFQRNASLQGGSGNTMLLNFFQDAVLNVLPDHSDVSSGQNFTMHGQVDGIPESQVTLVVLDDVMVGNIRAGGQYFQIRYIANDVHVVREIDESGFLPDGEPIPINMPSDNAGSVSDQPAADSAARFDIMALYTPAARAAAGGTTAMTALVNLAVAETNTAYSRSGIIPRVRLVYAGEVTDYNEVGNFSTDLARLQNPSDGFMDNVHSLRNSFGADLVSLIIEGDASLCGLGYLMTSLSSGFAPFAFSVAARNCATGNYTFGHEMGHNMGLRHDRINDNSSSTIFPYSHGYVDVTNNFRTIMGVATGCGNCPRIQNFSNPNVTFNGFPTGVSAASAESADAAASINAAALTVANWRAQIARLDFDRDGLTDIGIYRDGIWWIRQSSNGAVAGIGLGGLGQDKPVPADYDGDGKADQAVYRDGIWWIRQSSNGAVVGIGLGGLAVDIPLTRITDF